MAKKIKTHITAEHQRFEVTFIVDLKAPLRIVPGAPILEARTMDGDYVAIPMDAKVKEIPLALIPGDEVKSRTNGTKFWVVSGPHPQRLGDTVLPAYLVHDEFGGFSLIREELLEQA